MANGTVARIYSGFRGVDFRGEECALTRSPDSLNVWKDYRQTESIRTRPGMELVQAVAGPVYGIWFYKNMMLVHADSMLYKIDSAGTQIVHNDVNPVRSNGFVYADEKQGFIFYFMDQDRYFRYDGTEFKEVEGYVPTTSIGRAPGGGGSVNEDVNMLTGRRINTFLGDNTSFDFYLDAQDIDKDFAPIVKIDGEVVGGYKVDYAKGMISFTKAPYDPGTDGQDNVSVEFSKTISGYRESILGCSLVQLFDNRVFVSGNSDYPNVVWHCSLHDPTYFSDLDYYREGLDGAQVKGMVAGNNALWVFREPSDANTTVFYHTPALDDEYGKIYPSSHSSVTIGCVGKTINFNDDIIFFSSRGMEGISGDVTTEQMAAHRSSLVDSRLITEEDYKNMILEEWEGYLFVFIGNKAYLADSRAVFTNENHVEYEWFYWEMEKNITCAKVQDGILYLGTDDGIYTLTDNACALESYWVTPKDRFKHPNMLKTTNKRGCVAEATTGVPPLWEGEISVYAKTEDTGYELIGKFKDVKDYFVSRIKRKKFKDIQLKFYSKTRFSLETVTLECFVGGYIKR